MSIAESPAPRLPDTTDALPYGVSAIQERCCLDMPEHPQPSLAADARAADSEFSRPSLSSSASFEPPVLRDGGHTTVTATAVSEEGGEGEGAGVRSTSSPPSPVLPRCDVQRQASSASSRSSNHRGSTTPGGNGVPAATTCLPRGSHQGTAAVSQGPTSLSSTSRRSGLVMQIRTQTWVADSHGLFDYESRNVLLNEFKCACMRESYHICRVGTDVRFLPTSEALALYATDSRAKALAEIVWTNGYYSLAPPSNVPGAKEDRLWLVVRHLRDRSVAIVAGDVLKLGRFRLKVKEVVVSSQDAKTRRFFYGNDDDDCETVAPESGDTTAEFEGIDAIAMTGFPASARTDLDHHPSSRPDVAPEPSSTVEPSTFHKALTHRGRTFGPRTCRICLCEADDMDGSMDRNSNPLVAPCECKGSMKWVHLQCLRTWMAGRLNIRSVAYPSMVEVPSDTSYFLDNVESEEQKQQSEVAEQQEPLADSSESHGQQQLQQHHSSLPSKESRPRKRSHSHHGAVRCVELFEIPRPEVPYAILEPRTQQNKGLHIGRGHESDIRVADISVSRLHSVLRFQPPLAMKRSANSFLGSSGYGVGGNDAIANGCFFVEDNRSKFGTLLELRRPFRLEPNYPAVSVQVGRTVLTVMLKRRWRLRMPACIRHNPSDIYVVFRQPNPLHPPTPLVTGPVSPILMDRRHTPSQPASGLRDDHPQRPSSPSSAVASDAQPQRVLSSSTPPRVTSDGMSHEGPSTT